MLGSDFSLPCLLSPLQSAFRIQVSKFDVADMLPSTLSIMSLKQQASCAAFLGVSSHLAVFIRGEHHLYVSQIFYLYTSAFALLYGTEIMLFAGTSRKAQVATLAVSLSYILALFSSILVYRLLFHPLRKFPGPYGAKVSKFWNVAKAMKSTNYKVMESLHQSYGDFVRTGKESSTLAVEECRH